MLDSKCVLAHLQDLKGTHTVLWWETLDALLTLSRQLNGVPLRLDTDA